ncbi:MAG: response regulator [Thermoflexales bacterium]|nr:response regulator [Thermoflexales bacterium]
MTRFEDALARRLVASFGALVLLAIVVMASLIVVVQFTGRTISLPMIQAAVSGALVIVVIILAVTLFIAQYARSLENQVIERTATLSQHSHHLQLIGDVGQQVAADLGQDELLTRVVNLIQTRFGYDHVGIWLLSEGRECAVLQAWAGQSQPELDTLPTDEGGIVVGVCKTNTYRLANDVGGASDYRPVLPGIGSELALPLHAGKEVFGVIDIQSAQTGAFDSQAVMVLQVIAHQLTDAIENTRLSGKAQTDQTRFTTLQEAGQQLASASSLQDVVKATLGTASYLGAQHSHLILLDEREQPALYSTLPGWRQLTPAQAQALINQLTVEGLEGWVLEHRQSALVLDTRSDPRWVALPDLEQLPVASVICIPLFTPAGEPSGVLSYTHAEPDAFNPQVQQLAEAMADQVTIALQNARLYELARRQAQEAETLRQAGSVVAATLQHKEAIERILQELSRVVLYDAASVQLLREGYLEVVGGRGMTSLGTAVGMCIPVPGDNPNSVVIQERHPLILGDARAAYPNFFKGTAKGGEARSWMGVPLIVRDRLIGMLTIDTLKPDYFTPDYIGLVAAFADQVAIALENARLYQDIQREKQYFESLVLNSPVAIIAIDLEGSVTAWNPAAEKLFGYTQAEAIDHNIDELIETEAITYPPHTQGEVVRTISQRRHRDGSNLYVELMAVPVTVAGKRVGALVIYHDITELQQARQEAEAANRAKSAFLATMSHEIRTPMNAVIGMTGLLLDTPLSSEQREFANIVRNSGEVLLTIINDILDFSKIEAGRLDLERQPFDLRQCLESALDLVAAEAVERKLELGCIIEPHTPGTIVGDVTRLRQILVNLLSNAVKFTHQGEVVISVNASPHDAPPPSDDERETVIEGEYELHFAVKDTGVGIPADRIEHLFKSFSQVDASTTRKYGGTGLGLAISKKLSEMMGGTMWVESEMEKGSTFHFIIQARAAPAARPVYLLSDQPDLKGKRMLIVDDNLANRKILSLQAHSWGMESVAVASGPEALNLIRQNEPFDLVVLDMQMPEMDGLMLAEEIRKYSPADAMPLVMLTSLGWREEDDRMKLLSAFLTKPVKASELYNALLGVFASEISQARARRTHEPEEIISEFDASMAARLPLRLLLVEDNPINQKLATLILERLGYRPDLAGNGLEAVQAVQRQPYDVVLMDMQMPEMDGLEATQRIHQLFASLAEPGRRPPYIIAMTAAAMKEDREACLAAGMDDYVSKPIDVRELISALNKCQPIPDAPGSQRPEPARVEPPAPCEPGPPPADGNAERTEDAAGEAHKILDLAAIKRMRAMLGKQADTMLPELIDKFYSDALKLIDEAQLALAESRTPDLRRAAHTLKSNSATFGAMALSSVARELEHQARDGRLENGAELLSQIHSEYDTFKAALEAARKEL